jgi:hypothetical protein
MYKWIVIIIVGVVVSTVSPGGASAAYQGWVVDAETHEPVEGVVVFIEFVQSHFMSGRTYADAAESVTDKSGYFSVSDKRWSWNPWKMLTTDTIVTIFKSGYAPVAGGPWWALLDREWGAPKGTHIWKIEHGRPYILLKKYKSIEEMIQNRRPGPGRIGGPDVSPGSDVEPEKWKFLRGEVNKEQDILYPKNGSIKGKETIKGKEK